MKGSQVVKKNWLHFGANPDHDLALEEVYALHVLHLVTCVPREKN